MESSPLTPRTSRPQGTWPVSKSLIGAVALVVGVVGYALGQGIGPAPPAGQTQVMMSGAGGTADSNGSMIAVTGTDITGSSILYLVDTENKQLAIYQANGGSSSTQGVRLVGARRISLDLELDGFNDRTQSNGKDLGYKDLKALFEADGHDLSGD